MDGITEKKQLLLLQLRNQMSELQSLGIDPLHPDELLSAIAEFRQSYDTLETERSQLATEYKSLVQLSQQLTYAESPSFIFGSLFNEKVHEVPEIIEGSERTLKEDLSNIMPDSIQRKPSLNTDIEL